MTGQLIVRLTAQVLEQFVFEGVDQFEERRGDLFGVPIAEVAVAVFVVVGAGVVAVDWLPDSADLVVKKPFGEERQHAEGLHAGELTVVEPNVEAGGVGFVGEDRDGVSFFVANEAGAY